jgi:hypothetical protein
MLVVTDGQIEELVIRRPHTTIGRAAQKGAQRFRLPEKASIDFLFKSFQRYRRRSSVFGCNPASPVGLVFFAKSLKLLKLLKKTSELIKPKSIPLK